MVHRSKRSASFLTAFSIPKYMSEFTEKQIVKKETGTSHSYIFQGKFQNSLRGIILGSDSAWFPPANWQHWDRKSKFYNLNSILSIKTEINTVLIFTVHTYL